MTAPRLLQAARLRPVAPTLPTDCKRCGSPLHGRVEAITDQRIIWLCRCGKRRHVGRAA
jgi:hypothetical protein